MSDIVHRNVRSPAGRKGLWRYRAKARLNISRAPDAISRAALRPMTPNASSSIVEILRAGIRCWP